MREIAPWSQTKWITASSGLFLFSSGYALKNRLYLDTILLTTTSLISANYWRNATYSWRRTLDIIFAKIITFTYIYRGIVHGKYSNNYILFTSYSGLFGLGYLYYLSNKHYYENNPYWYRYHVGFHIVLTFEQFVVLNGILGCTRSNNK